MGTVKPVQARKNGRKNDDDDFFIIHDKRLTIIFVKRYTILNEKLCKEIVFIVKLKTMILQ